MSTTTINPLTGFYAIVQFGPTFRTIQKIGYKPGATFYIPSLFDDPMIPDAFGRIVVQPVPSEVWGSNNPIDWTDANKVREPFEAFLRTLYGAEVSLTGTEMLSGLYEQMKAADVLKQCGEVEVIDFMAFTDAIERQQVLPNGEQVDVLTLLPGDKRPLVSDLVRKSDSLMWQIIEFLGLWGMLPYLFAGGGITFKQLCDRLRAWKPDQEEREEYVFEILRPALVSKNHPVLSFDQINSLVQK